MSVRLFIASFVLIWSCTPDSAYQDKSTYGYALGTSYSIKYLDMKEGERVSENDILSIDSIFEVVNRTFSTYIDDSDLSKINSGDTTIEINSHFEKVFRESKRVHLSTNGYFDPTVGLLVKMWGLDQPEPSLPSGLSDVELARAKELVGLHQIEIVDGQIQKEDLNIYMDFNAIAKGYTVDLLAEYFESMGVDHFLIEIGGEVVAKGKNIRGDTWRIGIDKPIENLSERELHGIITLDDRAIATSGNYRKFYVKDGKKYVHTIDPIRKMPFENNMISVSVVADKCMTADAYATAFMAMGSDRSISFIKNQEHSLEVLFLYYDKRGRRQSYMTDGFDLIFTE